MPGAADKSEVAVSRRKTHGFKCRCELPPRSFADGAHHCIMVRSAKGSIEYKVVARLLRPDGELPSDQSWRSLGCKTTDVGEERGPHSRNPQCLEQRRMTFVRRGDNCDGSDWRIRRQAPHLRRAASGFGA
jgi:hypothetical protein